MHVSSKPANELGLGACVSRLQSMAARVDSERPHVLLSEIRELVDRLEGTLTMADQLMIRSFCGQALARVIAAQLLLDDPRVKISLLAFIGAGSSRERWLHELRQLLDVCEELLIVGGVEPIDMHSANDAADPADRDTMAVINTRSATHGR